MAGLARLRSRFHCEGGTGNHAPARGKAMSAVIARMERPPADLLEVVFAIDPQACERARRAADPSPASRAGLHRREISGEIQRRFGVSQPTAWLVVDMAVDMAGPV
jgi:hypothetical protein